MNPCNATLAVPKHITHLVYVYVTYSFVCMHINITYMMLNGRNLLTCVTY